MEDAQIREAYLKYKSHIYYDKALLFHRRQLAIFETHQDEKGMKMFDSRYKSSIFDNEPLTLDKKLSILSGKIESYTEDPSFIDSFLEELKLIYIPKEYSNPESNNNFISNQRVREVYPVDRTTVSIDIPTEIQIVVTLWVMKYGYLLDKELDTGCLGNRLILDKQKNGVIQGSGFFHPYYKQYQRWRDDGVKEAKSRLSNNESVVFLNLDIRHFFYSVRLDFQELENELNIPEDDNIHAIFKKLHLAFTEKVLKIGLPGISGETVGNQCILPIGLSSSYILANWYLSDFDQEIRQLLSPTYYSRYVDDIIILLANPDFDFHQKSKNDEVIFNFNRYKQRINRNRDKYDAKVSFKWDNLSTVERFILERMTPIVNLVDFPERLKTKYEKKEDQKKIFKLTCRKELYFQTKKTHLYFFDKTESSGAIDSLSQELEDRSSEFRDFPEDSENEMEFDEQAYKLIFEDLEEKNNALKLYKENRFGLSVFLANRIFTSLRRHNEPNKEESSKILRLFRGSNCLDHYQLWEKIFAYFLINEEPLEFVQFYQHAYECIYRIGKSEENETNLDVSDLQTGLFAHLNIAMEMALALNPAFLEKNGAALKDFEIFQNTNKDWFNIWLDLDFTSPKSYHISRFRRSNLIRHDYVVHALANYTKEAGNRSFNMVEKHLK